MINNLLTVFYMLLIVGITITINIVLGTVIANRKQKFDKKKFWKGIRKAFVILICVLLLCLTLELVPIVLSRVGIEVPTDLITVLEIILTTLTAYKKYALDCFDKFKTILDIKESE